MEWWQTTILICTSAITLFTLWDKIESRVKTLKQPTETLEQRVESLEKKVDLEYRTILTEYEMRFKRDLDRITELERVNNLTMKAILALIRHAETGNNKDKLKLVGDELQEYILNK